MEKRSYNYAVDKNHWIKNKRTKTKTKLRKLIYDAAKDLNKYNKIGVEKNRLALVNAYDTGGLNEVSSCIAVETQRIIDDIKAQKKHELNQLIENGGA